MWCTGGRKKFSHYSADFKLSVLQRIEQEGLSAREALVLFNARASSGRYGYRCVTAALRQMGEWVNHKMVQRLMQSLGLKSLVRPKRYRAWRGQQTEALNVLNRQLQTTRPNRKWVADVTEFNVRAQKCYLSPVLDL